MTTIHREREQKYEARPGTALPPLSGLPQVTAESGPETATLTAEYYDTDDLRLLGAGITLRRREGGTDEGWHLKLPEGTARREIQVPLDRSGDPVPDELTRLIRVHTRRAPLRPVARIETRRHTTTLRDKTGTSLAEVAVDEVASQTLGASTTLSRWDEIEVELTGGSRKLLRAADKRLRQRGLRRARYTAKLARALGAVPGGSGPTGTPSAGEAVLAYLRAQTARLKSLDIAVRSDEEDSVHQMRVTTRRLRSTLQSFTAILREPATQRLRDDLKWLGGVLGDARDNEVLSAYLRAELAGLPAELATGQAAALVSVHFAKREADARAAVARALESDRYFALLDELDRLLTDPPLTAEAAGSARDLLAAAVSRARKRTRRRIRRARRAAAGEDRDVALHEARKAAKRTRYAAETATPALGKRARRFAKRMKAVQSVLGDHHDAVSARAAAREIGAQANLTGETAFSFGLLYERADRDARHRQREARRAWKRAARTKLA